MVSLCLMLLKGFKEFKMVDPHIFSLHRFYVKSLDTPGLETGSRAGGSRDEDPEDQRIRSGMFWRSVQESRWRCWRGETGMMLRLELPGKRRFMDGEERVRWRKMAHCGAA